MIMAIPIRGGGSDYSAALLAEAIGANSVYIWTDVIGIFSTDPEFTKAAPIAHLSFDEAAEATWRQVLHPAPFYPLHAVVLVCLSAQSRTTRGEPDTKNAMRHLNEFAQ